MLYGLSNHDVSGAGFAAVFSRAMHASGVPLLPVGPRSGTKPILFPYVVRTGQFQPFGGTMLFTLHFHSCSTQHTGKFLKFWLSWSPLWNLWNADDSVCLRTAYQPGDLHPACCFGVVAVVRLDSTVIPWQHVKLLASSVTIFVVSLTFIVINPEYHFDILQEIFFLIMFWNLLDAKKKIKQLQHQL